MTSAFMTFIAQMSYLATTKSFWQIVFLTSLLPRDRLCPADQLGDGEESTRSCTLGPEKSDQVHAKCIKQQYLVTIADFNNLG